MELRTAQKLFLEKAEETRKNGNKRGLLIFATGLGKSLSALSDALKVAKKSEKILIIKNILIYSLTIMIANIFLLGLANIFVGLLSCSDSF